MRLNVTDTAGGLELRSRLKGGYAHPLVVAGKAYEGVNTSITLTMEDDTEVECAILTIFPVDAKEYIALLPLDENGQNHDGEVYQYSFDRTETGAPMLSNIESDEEYNKAAIAFDTVLQNAKEAEAAGIPLE